MYARSVCMEFLETSAFSKRLIQYLTDDEFRELQNHLRLNPEAGDIIPGAGGIRKLKVGRPEKRQGEARWASRYLLLLRFRVSDLVHYAV